MSQKLSLHGIFPALVTPFAADQSLDEDGLRGLVQHLAPNVNGFVVNGTTGDFPLLSAEERKRAIDIVVQAAPRHPVIAGTGAIGTREAIALTRDAEEAGARAVLVVAPYYLRPTPAGLYAHFAALAEAVPTMPIILYNFPQLVGQPIPVDVVRRLARSHKNIVGLKDTSGDMSYMQAVLRATANKSSVLVGRGNLVLPALTMGAVGAILAAANLVPETYQTLYQVIEEGDVPAAQMLQTALHPVTELIGRYGSLAVRAGLKLQGIDVGEPRLPLLMDNVPTADELAWLDDALSDLANF